MGAGDATVKLRVEGEDAGGVDLLEDVGDAAVEAKKDVDRLGDSDGLEELARDAEDSVKAFRKAERAFESAVERFRTAKLSPAFDEGSKAAQRLRQEVVKTGRRLNDLAKGVPPELRKVGRGFEDVEKRIKAARRQLTLFQKGARRIDGVVKSVTSLRTAVGALQVAFVAAIAERFISFMAGVSAEAVKQKAALDALTPALKTNLGSTDAAAEAQEFLARTSERLRVPLANLTGEYVKLTAATKDTAVEGAPTERIFAAITEAGRALGASNEDLSNAFRGLSQAAGSSNIQMDEVRQFTEPLPGLFNAWAKELGLTTGELKKLISDGKVTADQLGVVADAAEKLAGSTLAEQLGTTAGQLQAVAVSSEAARLALAEGLEPGVKALLGTLLEGEDAVNALAGFLGGQLSTELQEVSAILGATQIAAKLAFVQLEQLGTLGDVITEGLGLTEFRDNLEGIPAAAKEAFDAIESGALVAAGAVEEGSGAVEVVAESFGTLPAAAKEAFRELAAAAGVDAKTRKKIAQDLAEDVAAITEESVKARAALEQVVLAAARRGGDEEIQVREAVAEAQKRIAEEAVAATREAIAEQLRLAKEAAAEEKKLVDERIQGFDKILNAATDTERKRVEAQTAASASIEALDEQLATKRVKLQEEFVKAHAEEEEKRSAAVKKVEDAIVAFAEESSRQRIALEEKLLEEARKASEERIALADKEADAIIAANDRVRAVAAGEGDTAGAGEATTEDGGLAATNQGVTQLTANLAELGKRLDDLQFKPVSGALDPDAILSARDAYDSAKLGIQEFGQVSTQAAQEAATAQEELKARAEAVLEAIQAELAARKELSAAQLEGDALFKEALSGQVEALQTLIDTNGVTGESVTALADVWALYNGETREATVEASQAIQESLAQQREKQDEATKATEDATKAQESQIGVFKDAEGQITILQKVRQELADTEEEAVKPTEEAAEAIKAEGEAAEAAGAPVEKLAGATDSLGEGAERADTGLEGAAEQAQALSDVPPPAGMVSALQEMGGVSRGLKADLEGVATALQEIVDLDGGLQQVLATIKAIAAANREGAAAAREHADELANVANAEAAI